MRTGLSLAVFVSGSLAATALAQEPQVYGQAGVSGTATVEVQPLPNPPETSTGLAVAQPLQVVEVQAQPAPVVLPPRDEKRAVVGVNLLYLAIGEVALEGEVKLADSFSLGLGYSQYVFDTFLEIADAYDSYYLGRFRVEPRLYPFGDALRGFYLGAAGSLSVAHIERGDITGTGAGAAITGNLGYQWLAGPVAIALGAGAGYQWVSVEAHDSTSRIELDLTGFALDIRTSVGVAF